MILKFTVQQLQFTSSCLKSVLLHFACRLQTAATYFILPAVLFIGPAILIFDFISGPLRARSYRGNRWRYDHALHSQCLSCGEYVNGSFNRGIQKLVLRIFDFVDNARWGQVEDTSTAGDRGGDGVVIEEVDLEETETRVSSF